MIVTAAFTLAIIALFVVLSAGIHYFVRKRIKGEERERNNEVVGFVLAVVGTIYAVVLAFVVVVVWEHYDAAEANSEREVSAVADIYRAADDLPPALKSTEQALVMRYIDLMINDELPAMQNGTHTPKSQLVVDQLRKNITHFVPDTPIGTNAREQMSVTLEKLGEARRERVVDGHHGLPLVLWLALIVGAITTIGFVYLFELDHLPTQLIVTSLLAIVIGVMFALIAQLNHPYQGASAIDASGWQRLEDILKLHS
jgi:hypothetical protein